MCECDSRLTRCWCCWRAGCCSGWWCSWCRTSSTPPSGTVLYCTVLYCTVLTYPTLSTGEQAAPLPTLSVSPPGDAVPVQGPDQDSVQFVQVTHDYSHQLSRIFQEGCIPDISLACSPKFAYIFSGHFAIPDLQRRVPQTRRPLAVEGQADTLCKITQPRGDVSPIKTMN